MIFVVDTSSLIWVKERIAVAHRAYVFSELSIQCDNDLLVFPPEVFKELENGTKNGKVDLPFMWAKTNKKNGTRFGRCYGHLETVMAHPIACKTPDPNQTAGPDDADPHVLATALHVRDALGVPATVVTNEANKKPPQIPLHVAAGALQLPTLNMHALLIHCGVWDDTLLV
jgi:hypothetical protein